MHENILKKKMNISVINRKKVKVYGVVSPSNGLNCPMRLSRRDIVYEPPPVEQEQYRPK